MKETQWFVLVALKDVNGNKFLWVDNKGKYAIDTTRKKEGRLV